MCSFRPRPALACSLPDRASVGVRDGWDKLADQRSGTQRQGKVFFFVNEKEAKKTSLIYAVLVRHPTAQSQKVFCFFFTKKKTFLFSELFNGI
jgi:hypothetical protein